MEDQTEEPSLLNPPIDCRHPYTTVGRGKGGINVDNQLTRIHC